MKNEEECIIKLRFVDTGYSSHSDSVEDFISCRKAFSYNYCMFKGLYRKIVCMKERRDCVYFCINDEGIEVKCKDPLSEDNKPLDIGAVRGRNRITMDFFEYVNQRKFPIQRVSVPPDFGI